MSDEEFAEWVARFRGDACAKYDAIVLADIPENPALGERYVATDGTVYVYTDHWGEL